eukprot:SAG11_NODE_25823_length_353_cov_1.208661_1_plen_88_part_00
MTLTYTSNDFMSVVLTQYAVVARRVDISIASRALSDHEYGVTNIPIAGYTALYRYGPARSEKCAQNNKKYYFVGLSYNKFRFSRIQI